jgi:poly(A) polymerase
LGRLQRYSTYKEGGIMNTEFWTDILTSKNVDIQLDDLQKAGVIKAIFPEVEAMVGFGGEDQGHKDLWDHTKKVVQQAKAVPEIRWAALFHDVGKVEAFSRENGKITFHQHEFVSARLFRQAMRRTRLLQGNLLDNVNTLIKNLALVEGYSSEWTDSAVRRLNKELGDSRDYTLLLARADVTSKHAHKRARIQQLMHELGERAEKIAKADAVVPPLPKGLGTALMDTFGLSPSKKLGDVREALEAAVLSGKLEAHKDIDYYIDYLKNHPADFGLPV